MQFMVNPPQPILDQDSATTKAEKMERNRANAGDGELASPSPKKRNKPHQEEHEETPTVKRQKGVAPIKSE